MLVSGIQSRGIQRIFVTLSPLEFSARVNKSGNCILNFGKLMRSCDKISQFVFYFTKFFFCFDIKYFGWCDKLDSSFFLLANCCFFCETKSFAIIVTTFGAYIYIKVEELELCKFCDYLSRVRLFSLMHC